MDQNECSAVCIYWCCTFLNMVFGLEKQKKQKKPTQNKTVFLAIQNSSVC